VSTSTRKKSAAAMAPQCALRKVFHGIVFPRSGAGSMPCSMIRSKSNDGTLVIRHGLLTGTTIEPRPGQAAADLGRFYLIDLDYFDDTERALDLKATTEQLKAYNETLYRFVRWTIDKGKIYPQLEPR
jgi:hypothetical protein